MFNVGGGELLVIMLIALIVLGPQRLGPAARQIGRVMGDLRRISSGFQQELKDAFDDDDGSTPARRTGSVPLASAVAEADGRPTPSDRRDETDADETAGQGTDAPTTAPTTEPSPADESTMAPAVAAALDEIVTPLDRPSDDQFGGTPEATSPVSEGDTLGDERAAS